MRRVRQGLFAAACWLVCGSVWAQGWSGGQGPYYAQPVSYGYPVPGEVAYEPAYGPAQQEHLAMRAQQSTVSPEVMYHLLPADRGWLYDDDSRLDLVLKQIAGGSWVSVEYLNFAVRHPGNFLLGATTTLTSDPRQPFNIPNNDPPGTTTPTTTLARAAHTGQTDWSDINGIKGSFGLPILDSTWFEGSFWGIEQTTDNLQFDALPARVPTATLPAGTIPQPVRAIVVPLLTNGQPGTRLIVYDNSFNADYSTQMWSADANLVFNNKTVDRGWNLQSIVGFRHLEYSERLSFQGSYTNVSQYNMVDPTIIAPRSNSVNSSAANYLYGMNLGFRTEFRHEHFTLGVEPKAIFAGNVQRGSVQTQNLREPGDVSLVPLDDPTVSSFYSDTHFAPGFDLSTYLKIHVTERMTFKIGYNALFLAQLGTADKNIYYNDNGDTNPPAVVVRRTSANRFVDGLTIGGEVLLW